MSRTKKDTKSFKDNWWKEYKYTRKNHQNILGICNCIQCKVGRAGKKDNTIAKAKRKLRKWRSNKPPTKGIYTD